MSLLDRARRALGVTGDKPGRESESERSDSDQRRGADSGRARSTQEAASAPNPSVAAEEVD